MAVVTERLAVVINGDPASGVAALRRVGAEAGKTDHALTGVSSAFERVSRTGGHLGLATAAVGLGAVTVGLAGAAVGVAAFARSSVQLGIQFQDSLNSMQAVTHSTGTVMDQVAKKARDLGNDLSLPATSAADAADAMVELAKGNLTAQQAMDAAKGTLELAAAAQISGAQAATIQADAINAFSLKASAAGHVADVLANAANAATGEISDFAFGLQASSAVAHQFGLSLDDNVTALALFANAGIHGQDAGTSLKSALLALASPTDKAKDALKTLGVQAFDSSGKFVGLRTISDELAKAHGRLSQEAFASAVKLAFGSDAARAAGVLAAQGAKGWDTMSASIGRSGGAAQVAQAKMKGVGGALQGLQSQVETVKIDVFTKSAPSLEAFIRGLSDRLPGAADAALSGLDKFTAFAQRELPQVRSGIEVLGPAIEQFVADKVTTAGTAVEQILLPALRGVGTVAKDAAPAVEDVAHVVSQILVEALKSAGQVADDFERHADQIGDVLADVGHAAADLGHDAMPVLTFAFHAAADTGMAVVDVAVAIGRVLGPLAGPAAKAAAAITLTVVAVKALKVAGSGIVSIGSGVSSAITKLDSAAASFNGLGPKIARSGIQARQAWSGLSAVTRSVAVGLPILGVGLGIIGASMEARAGEVRELTDTFSDLYGKVRQGGQAGQDAAKELAAVSKAVDNRQLFLFGDKFKDAFGQAKQAAADYQRSLSETDKAQQDVTRTQNDLALAIKKYGQNSPQAAAAAGQYNSALDRQSTLEHEVARATETATEKLQDKINLELGAADSSVAFRQSQLDVDRAITGVSTAQDAYNQALQQYGANSAQAKQASQDLQQARLDEEQAALRQVAAAGKLAVDALPAAASAEDKARASTRAQITAFDDLTKKLAPGDPLRVRLDQYRRKLEDIPPTKTTTITTKVGGVAAAASAINRLTVSRIVDIELHIGAQVAGGALAGHRAGGGAAAAGVPIVVGENRPEVFIPSSSGTIRPNTAGINSGGPTYQITNHITLTGGDANTDGISRAMAWSIRTAGG